LIGGVRSAMLTDIVPETVTARRRGQNLWPPDAV
jgi:hypothetical protein